MSKKEKRKEIRIANRKARFEYEILERYLAGIALMGTEIKSLRDGKPISQRAMDMWKEVNSLCAI